MDGAKAPQSSSKPSLWEAVFLKGAWRPLLGGFLIHLCLGTIYCWGDVTTYTTSRLRWSHHGITYTSTFPAYILGLFSQGMMMPLGGMLERRFGPRKTGFLACLLVTAGNLLAAIMVREASLVGLMFTAGVIFGCGVGVGYVAPLVCGYKWLPDHKGVVSGVVVAGFGGGAVVFDQVATLIVNPHDVDVRSDDDDKYDDDFWDGYIDCDEDPEVCHRVSTMYIVLAISFFALSLIGSLLLIDPPDKKREIEDPLLTPGESAYAKVKVNESSENGVNEEEHAVVRSDYQQLHDDENDIDDDDDDETETPLNETQQMLNEPQSVEEIARHPVAQLEVLCFLFTAVSGLFIAGAYKIFGEKYFSSDSYLSAVGSAASGANLLGRIVWGSASDHIGWPKSIFAMSAIMTVLLATYNAIAALESAPLFLIWTSGLLFCYGGNFALYPTITADLFGRERAGVNYGVIFFLYAIASCGGLFALPHIAGSTYPTMLNWVLTGCQASGTIVAFFLGQQRSKTISAP